MLFWDLFPICEQISLGVAMEPSAESAHAKIRARAAREKKLYNIAHTGEEQEMECARAKER